MNRNQIIDFLCDQSIDKEKVLYEMLKEESDLLDTGEYYDEKIDLIPKEEKPQFINRSKCEKCRYYKQNECVSNVARDKCGEPEYKYFEEK